MHANIAKIVTTVFWAVLGYSFVFPFSDGIQSPLVMAGAVMAGVHLLEFILQRNKLNAINAGGVNGFIQTMIFGFGYWLPLLQKKEK
ncbi:MAG: DUF1145 domain-containing protein [Cellvibrionaceae bacterium]